MIKGHRQDLNVLVKPVANPLFDFPREAEEAVPPHIPEGRHGECDGHDHAPKLKKHSGCGLSEGQGVNRPLDDHGNQELEKVDGQKAEKTGDQNPAVSDKILFQRKKILERFFHQKYTLFRPKRYWKRGRGVNSLNVKERWDALTEGRGYIVLMTRIRLRGWVPWKTKKIRKWKKKAKRNRPSLYPFARMLLARSTQEARVTTNRVTIPEKGSRLFISAQVSALCRQPLG
jgi:hypothetical protein